MSDKRTIRVSLSEKEFNYLRHLLNHFSDWMAYDDRSDHGMARLKWFREEMPREDKAVIYRVAGRFKHRKIGNKRRKKDD